jgi:hypothetical protein
MKLCSPPAARQLARCGRGITPALASLALVPFPDLRAAVELVHHQRGALPAPAPFRPTGSSRCRSTFSTYSKAGLTGRVRNAAIQANRSGYRCFGWKRLQPSPARYRRVGWKTDLKVLRGARVSVGARAKIKQTVRKRAAWRGRARLGRPQAMSGTVYPLGSLCWLADVTLLGATTSGQPVRNHAGRRAVEPGASVTAPINLSNAPTLSIRLRL